MIPGKVAQGMDNLFRMTTPFEIEVEGETKQGMTITNAAKQVGLGHLVFIAVLFN